MTERIPLRPLLAGGGGAIDGIASRIEEGAVFIYPTDTIYGIGGRADSAEVEERIFSIKGRNKSSPLILVAAHIGAFESFRLTFTRTARVLAQRFWPGNLTLIVSSEGSQSPLGIRISDHPFITALYDRFKLPLFSTSANRSGDAYVDDPDAIYSAFRGTVDFMIDAGVLPQSPPSTIVRVNDDDSFEILREGPVSADSIFTATHNQT